MDEALPFFIPLPPLILSLMKIRVAIGLYSYRPNV